MEDAITTLPTAPTTAGRGVGEPGRFAPGDDGSPGSRHSHRNSGMTIDWGFRSVDRQEGQSVRPGTGGDRGMCERGVRDV